jgi:hypothetical protein
VALRDIPDEDSTSVEVPWLLVGLIVVHIVFGLTALVWQAGKAWPIAVLWSGACALVGSTIGFLFGIPRTIQGDDGTKSAEAEKGDGYRLRVNTNLEQISDWLTKILVGVGLTQLNQVPGQLMRAAAFIAKGIGDNQSQRTLALALVIYFPVLGFLSGYLCTRLFLQPAFRLWDTRIRRESIELK